MRINVKQAVLDYEDKPVMINKLGPDGSVALDENHLPIQQPEELRAYLSNALNSIALDEKEVIIPPERKAKIFELSLRLYPKKNGYDIDFSVDELALMKERVGKIYGAMIYGRICEILDPKSAT